MCCDAPKDITRRVVKDMSLSHADFFRVLPGIVNAAAYDTHGNVVRIHKGRSSIEIRLSAEHSRRLSALRLPSTRVELLFHNCTDETVAEFLANFDLRFRRGGG